VLDIPKNNRGDIVHPYYFNIYTNSKNFKYNTLSKNGAIAQLGEKTLSNKL
jgi:hypothetical protein